MPEFPVYTSFPNFLHSLSLSFPGFLCLTNTNTALSCSSLATAIKTPQKVFSKSSKKKYFLHKCINSVWNSLPQDIIEAKNLIGFKKGLNIYMDNKNIQNHNSKYFKINKSVGKYANPHASVLKSASNY